MKEKYYHGDVILKRIGELPPGCEPVRRHRGRIVLAEGEATGHAHTIADTEAEAFTLEGALFLKVDAPVEISHEEHATGTVEPGIYRVRIARERDHLAQMTQRVVD